METRNDRTPKPSSRVDLSRHRPIGDGIHAGCSAFPEVALLEESADRPRGGLREVRRAAHVAAQQIAGLVHHVLLRLIRQLVLSVAHLVMLRAVRWGLPLAVQLMLLLAVHQVLLWGVHRGAHSKHGAAPLQE
jgi:hypothetical protein